MKRERSASPESCAILLEPSIADCLTAYPYVWKGHILEVKTSKGTTKTQTFRRLQDMYQKILWDILDGMVSRLKKGQTIGLLTLHTIKIKDNVAYLPEVSEPEQASWHPAQQYYNVVVALLGTDGTITERDSFYKLLKMLIKTNDCQKYISGLEALRFHRLIQSSKDNNTFIGDALDKLKGVGTRTWETAYSNWSYDRNYNVKAAIQGNSYFLEVYFYRGTYPHSCIGVLKFIKNICKHLNDNRRRDGETPWSEEQLENFFEYHFPGEMTHFFEFLWCMGLPVNVRDVDRQILPVYLMRANNGKSLNFSGVISGTSNDQAAIYTHLATRELQTIKNSDLEFIKELGSGTYRTRHYGKWMGSNVVIQKINLNCFTDCKLKDRLLDDFWKEAHILGQLNHPNILSFYGVVTDGQVKDLATVTEYMMHGSLEKVLQSNDLIIDEEKRLVIAIAAAVGLDYLHAKSIALFDFKSHNLLLDMRDEKRPICKIGNLELGGGERATVPGMAPELLNHNNNVNLVTEKVHVFSFGIVLRELLTGEISAAGIHPQIPAECSKAWKFIMESCWLHDPKARPRFSEIVCFLRSMLVAAKIPKIGRGLEDSHLATRELQTIKNCDLEFIKELGSGTYGTVYYGKWKGSNVAIKKIKPSCFTDGTLEDRSLADFGKEAYILGQLHHPNMVAFYGVVTDVPGTNLATVTEYMVNGSLKQILQRKDGTIDRRKRLIIAMDAAFAMEYLHEKSIVHFDLKSHNFLVDMRDPQRPVCKIGDLGISKIKQRTFVSGGVRGTVPWMAPELLKGHRKHNFVTEKVDVYSFGIVMWELLTGEEPYADLRSEEIIAGIIKGRLRPEIPSWCDPTWSSLMERCWSSDPESRPSFSDIAKELRAMSAAMNIK